MNAITTTHKLDFFSRKWWLDQSYVEFKIGTCSGIYDCHDKTYRILAITNDVVNNGHFEDVLEWFEYACRRDGYNLMFQEVANNRLGRHLIDKRGFTTTDNINYIKIIS